MSDPDFWANFGLCCTMVAICCFGAMLADEGSASRTFRIWVQLAVLALFWPVGTPMFLAIYGDQA